MTTIRQPDDLGRVVLPVMMRRDLGIHAGTGVEIQVEGQSLIVRKWRPRCIFCNAETDFERQGRPVCLACRDEMGAKLR